MIHETEALAILTSIPHLGAVRIKQLIALYGSAVAVLEVDAKTISTLPELNQHILRNWGSWRKNRSWETNLELAEANGVELISYQDSRYPKRLLEIPDHPVLLYVKGKLEPKDTRCIAIVGTRQASIYGQELAEQTASYLAAMGYTVVSGLARGIDTAAHRGALQRGRTLAVIGSGLSRIYPQENLILAKEIAEQGALISEFGMNVPPDRQNFPQRNRIVAGMTLGTVLIEAPFKSGAMLTMERAWQYKRRLFAYPGRVDNEDFRGNHWLIKNGQAQLIEKGEEIAGAFENLFGLDKCDPLVQIKQINMNEEERKFLTQLPNQEISIENMAQLTQLPIMKLNSLLMSLLLKKAIKEFPGKIYKKLVV